MKQWKSEHWNLEQVAMYRTVKNRGILAKGFTLVELLVVIAIITIIAGLSIPAVMMAVRTSNEFAITTRVSQLNTAVETFRNEMGVYPPDQYYDNSMIGWVNPSSSTLAIDLIQRYGPLLQKIAPNHREFQAAPGVFPGNELPIVAWYRQRGQYLNPTNALNFWLGGGLSDSKVYPLSEACRRSVELPAGNAASENNYAVRLQNFKPLSFYDFGSTLDIDPLGYWSNNANGPNGAGLSAFNLEVPSFLRSAVQAYTTRPVIYFVDTALPNGASSNTLFAPFLLNSATSPPTYKTVNVGEVNLVSPLGFGSNFYAEGKFQIITCGLDELYGGLDWSNPSAPVLSRDARDNICNFADSKRLDTMENAAAMGF